MRIYQTKDYKSFKVLLGNRGVIPSHVKHLIESILEKDMLEHNPIIVNEKMEVIDGQHRLAAASVIGSVVYYTILYGAGIKEAQMYNTNSQSWKTSDFINLYIKLNNPNYIILSNFCNKYSISASTAMLLMEMGLRKRDAMRVFKSGRFIAKNISAATVMIERLSEIKPYTEQGVWKDSEFIQSMYLVYKKVSHKDLMKQIKRMKNKLTPKSNVKDYLRVIEDVFNYRLHYKVNFFS